jgi:hypothetical protein
MQVSLSESLSVPAAVTAFTFTFFLPALNRARESGPFSGTSSVRPVVQTLVVAGTSAESAACRAASSGSLVPPILTSVTSAGMHAGSAGSALCRQTSTSKTHALLTVPSRSQAASPSKQRTSFPGFGFAGLKGG